MRKIVCYAFGIIGILAGLSLIYCVFTGVTNQRIYFFGSIELFVSTAIFLYLSKQLENEKID